jgi:hypothetical protein
MHLPRMVRIAAVFVSLAFSFQAVAQTAPPKSLAFVVRYVDSRPAGEFVVTFENGEVWQQADLRTKVTIQRGDQVVIRRSSNGTFTLVSRDGQTTRVKRVN